MKFYILLLMLLFNGIASASQHEGNRIYHEITLAEIDLTYFCGTAKLHVWKAKDSGQTMLTLRNAEGQIVDRRLLDGGLNATECGDFLKIGEPTLVISGWTGGAHCCADHVFYAVGDRPRLLLAFYQGDIGGIEEPVYQDLDGDGLHEVILTEDKFAGLGGMCGTCVRYMKVVFCYLDGIYAECTLNQKEWLEKEKDDCIAWIKDIYRQEPYAPPFYGPSGVAAAYYGYSALQGNEITAMTVLESILPKAASQHFKRLLPEIRARLSSRERLLKRTQHRMKVQYHPK